jgi:hypothetical protein
VAATAHPDYLGNHPGAAFGGRALAPLPFDGRRLGKDFARVRPPRPEFMGPTGMMVARNELDALLRPFSSFANLRTAMGMVLRQAADRLRYPRGTRLVMGNALVARLFYSLRQRRTPIRFDTALSELIVEQGRVVGGGEWPCRGKTHPRKIWRGAGHRRYCPSSCAACTSFPRAQPARWHRRQHRRRDRRRRPDRGAGG